MTYYYNYRRNLERSGAKHRLNLTTSEMNPIVHEPPIKFTIIGFVVIHVGLYNISTWSIFTWTRNINTRIKLSVVVKMIGFDVGFYVWNELYRTELRLNLSLYIVYTDIWRASLDFSGANSLKGSFII